MTGDRQVWLEAQAHRRRLGGIRSVAVTGSCGKTTTVDLAARVLASRYRGSSSDGFWNCGLGVAHSILAVRPTDEFFVQELGAWGPGTIDEGLELVAPQVGVVTNLRNDHYSRFHGPVGAQAEKGKLVERLPSEGTAVLNADDPLVAELAGRAPGRVLTFGRSPAAGLRATNVQARWPDRLRFDVEFQGRTACVQTRLVGEHLLGSALAALGAGLALGLTLDEAASALDGAPPSFRRMRPEAIGGITFLRDDYKAPADSVDEALDFLASARAARRIAVLGRISDFPGRSRPCYTRIARWAIEELDAVVFVGARAAELWGVHRSTAPADQLALRRLLAPGEATLAGPEAGAMLVFESVREAASFLEEYLHDGDLALVKGSGQADHLERIVLSRQRTVRCWLAACGRKEACDVCRLVGVSSA
jgi:UDP-N-acetylmuramoyl-tripeptide--D-alanyl-D-alanine ligase